MREKFKNLRACGSLGLCECAGLALQGPAFLDCNADSGLVNLQGRLLYDARRVHNPHMSKKSGEQTRATAGCEFPSQAPPYIWSNRKMIAHSTETQASEDGSERPDVGHVGDKDLNRSPR